MGVGIAILANTRPYEGLVFCIPVAIAFLRSRPFSHQRRPAMGLIAAVLIPAFAATGYYNRAVTGSALQMPYTEYARQYVYIPLFNFQPLQPTKVYRTPVIYDLHQNWERERWENARSWQLIPIRLPDWKGVASVVLGSVLMGVLVVVFAADLWRDRRIRLPLTCVLAALAGSLIEVRLLPALRRAGDGGAIHSGCAGIAASPAMAIGSQPAGRTISLTRVSGARGWRGRGFARARHPAPGTDAAAS